MVEVEVAQQPGGYVLVRLRGEIDMSQAGPVQQAFARALAAGRTAVLIDLCEVRFIAVVGTDWVDAAVDEGHGGGDDPLPRQRCPVRLTDVTGVHSGIRTGICATPHVRIR